MVYFKISTKELAWIFAQEIYGQNIQKTFRKVYQYAQWIQIHDIQAILGGSVITAMN